MNDESIMPSGKHKGKALKDVPAHYLLWLYDNNRCRYELKDYILDNMDVLKEEVKEKEK